MTTNMISLGLPKHGDAVCLVLGVLGKFGPTDGETDPRQGQYEPPLRIVARKTAEGWARDVTAQIAQEVALAHEDLPAVVERAG